ncbi:hypothetical protein Pyrde_1338 [Pyrodictium delaneyi]|uniref:Band 7 domain-containing protein n=1 Tax=Pyrodictium delaneyi TaxID=1273541 RepID=A0A0P0N4Z1_9CREN|nr:SPFH domain-containing protein [Pyrodictium delaneyi]ALL01384.1 hypothetical protein Pyrde_1338 [Pyrodictium delaneyi]OWJ54516.1 hypothetical protein Pdsh_06885 [Pyrodictium delaneyi]
MPPAMGIPGARALKLAAVLVVAVLVAVALTSQYELDIGEAGVIVDKVLGRKEVVFGPTWGIKAPWAELKLVPIYVQTVHLEGDSAIVAVTKDGARVPVEIQVRYKVRKEPGAVLWLVEEYQYDIHNRIRRDVIERAASEAVRAVVGKYMLVDIVPRIQEISEEIAVYLKNLLLEDPSVKNAIEVIDVVVKKIDIPPELSQAILRKLTAQQEAEAAKYEAQREIIRAQMEAEKKVIAANATAQQQIIQAKAEAEKRIIEANATATKLVLEAKGRAEAIARQYTGEAMAIAEIAKTLNVTVDKAAEIYYYIKMVELYREVLPSALQNAKITVVTVPGNATLPLGIPIIGILPLDEKS